MFTIGITLIHLSQAMFFGCSEREAAMGSHRPYKEPKHAVGRRLVALRTQAGLSQTALSQLLGVSRRSILKWEGDEGFPSEDHLRHLIEVFVMRRTFTPGRERDEAETLWMQMREDAGGRIGPFDAHWFDHLKEQPAREAQGLPHSLRPAQHAPSFLVDWGEAIDIPELYGRETELATLEQWMLSDRCRVVALLGLGGIGKTSLAVTLAHQVIPYFDAVLFRSLRNAPPLDSLLDGLIRTISAQQLTPPERVPDKIAALVELLRGRRCLLILDNLEAIIQSGTPVGEYRAGYADYGTLIQHMGETAHLSCLLLTSREKPTELGPLEGRTTPVRSLVLAGLAERACQLILEEKNIVSTERDHIALARLYQGNPLALKLVSEPIRELFGGDVSLFLAAGDTFYNGVGKLLEQQFARLAPLEQVVLYWLAIERELIPIEALLADLSGAGSQREVFQALESLRRRLLIERGAGRPAFTLQPVIMEYLTDQLVEHSTLEIVTGQPALLRSHALVQATAKDYVRRSQERLIAQSLLDCLDAHLGSEAAAEQGLLALLETWRGRPAVEQGYGPGNMVNLLRLLRGDLRGINFSHLTIRQAYLQEVEAQDVRLDHVHLTQSVLAEAFEYSTCVALSPDGAYLAASTQVGEVRLWRLADRTPIMSVSAHTGGTYGVAITADGRLVVSSAIDGTAKVWATPSGQLRATLRGHTGGVYCVAVASDQQLVASGSADGTVRLWDLESGVCQALLEGHTGAVWDVTFAREDRLLVSSSVDGTIKLWQVASGQCVATLRGHTGPVWGVALRADGRILASGGADGMVRLWDLDSGVCRAVLQAHTGGVRGVTLSADGQLLASGGLDRTIRLWEVGSGACTAVLEGHTGGVWDVALSADGRQLASASFDGTIRLWEPDSRASLAVLQGHSSTIRTVTLDANGQLIASGSSGGIIRLWESDRGVCRLTLQGHVGMVFSVALSADRRMLASSGHDGMIRLWDTETGTCLATLRGHIDAVLGIALSADGQLLASGGRDGTIRLWDLKCGVCVAIWQAEQAGIRDVALLADGRLLVSGSFDGVIRLWDVGSGRSLLAQQAHTGLIWRVAISADGRRMASAGEDGTIRLWDTGNGQIENVLTGHTGAVYGVALSFDGRVAISGGHDGTLRLWHTESGTCQMLVERHGIVWNVALAEDGRVVVSGEHDGTVGMWDTSTGALLRLLRPDRPYERMDITGLRGITEAQRAALKALGAVERSTVGRQPLS
jgi:WD40 repeat protein/transcriptional regulator with XRE-family HTH domain